MEMVTRKQKTLKAASEELGISYSQGKRIYKRYKEGGDKALVHGNRGKASNKKSDESKIRKAIELYQEKYNDFGPTLAQEMLLERDGIAISVSTLLLCRFQNPCFRPYDFFWFVIICLLVDYTFLCNKCQISS
ncbi:MAG: helix-turn-helix domain-containing protein [Spirochaetaceae bacterium]|nr:helix-turn-helix domain-containing protein [Spirochaetaceae bacterium]